MKLSHEWYIDQCPQDQGQGLYSDLTTASEFFLTFTTWPYSCACNYDLLIFTYLQEGSIVTEILPIPNTPLSYNLRWVVNSGQNSFIWKWPRATPPFLKIWIRHSITPTHLYNQNWLSCFKYWQNHAVVLEEEKSNSYRGVPDWLPGPLKGRLRGVDTGPTKRDAGGTQGGRRETERERRRFIPCRFITMFSQRGGSPGSSAAAVFILWPFPCWIWRLVLVSWRLPTCRLFPEGVYPGIWRKAASTGGHAHWAHGGGARMRRDAGQRGATF